jgi:myo-inositol-1(or 4)-monophosphatase
MLADIELVKSLVVEAGRRAHEQFGKVSSELKADFSLVTEVDRSNELFLREELSRAYPDFAFVGEEYGWQGAEDVPVWCCDPIDGTTNYVYGLPEWCVSVGLVYKGESVLGAISAPVLGELFWAVKGEGAYCNGNLLKAPDQDHLLHEDTICLTSNCIKGLETKDMMGRIRCVGTIAMELAYTARGSLRATVGLHEGIVDIAAALCICSEAGCEFRYLSGELVDIDALLRNRRTDRHFVYAPPKMQAHIRSILKPRD